MWQGNPIEPTPPAGDSSNRIATTAFVAGAVAVGANRERLIADRTYFVSTTGSNLNDGLSALTPFADIPKALSVVANTLDLGGHRVAIVLADGTYTKQIAVTGPWVGIGVVTIVGSDPANCIINTAAATCVVLSSANLAIQGVAFQSTISGDNIDINLFSVCFLTNVKFGGSAGVDMQIAGYSEMFVLGAVTIAGARSNHIHQPENGFVNYIAAVTISPGATMDGTFCGSRGAGAYSSFQGSTFTGSFAGGTKFIAHDGSVIDCEGQGVSFLPGNSPGIVEPGGMYIGTITIMGSDVLNSNIVNSGTFVATGNPATSWALDGSAQTFVIANGATQNLPDGSGKVILQDQLLDEAIAEFLCSGGAVAIGTSIGGIFVAGAPGAGKVGVEYPGGGAVHYRVNNNSGFSRTIAFSGIRTRVIA